MGSIATQLKHAGIDADQIGPKLYQGAFFHLEMREQQLHRLGFSTVAFCAEELQPDGYAGSLRIVRAALDDTSDEVKCQRQFPAAVAAAENLVHRNGRVLVTCAAGLNRSGLVSALTLWLRANKRRSMGVVVRQISAMRLGALCNPFFVKQLLEHARGAP